jgi:hypothetical protein
LWLEKLGVEYKPGSRREQRTTATDKELRGIRGFVKAPSTDSARRPTTKWLLYHMRDYKPAFSMTDILAGHFARKVLIRQ